MKDQKEKWEIVNSKSVYKDPWIRLRVDNVRRPNGLESEYSVVELKGGVAVVALTSDENIYLVGQYRYPIDLYSWEIPQGAFTNFDHNESPIEIAKKELSEETGLSAKTWYKLGVIHTLNGSTNDVVHLFLAQDVTEGVAHPDITENIQVKKVEFAEFNEMIKKEEITDAATVAAVLLAEKLKKSRKSE